MIEWVEITDHEKRRRLISLSQVLNEQGIANRLDLVLTSANPDTLMDEVLKTCERYRHVRLSGTVAEMVPALSVRQPSIMRSLQMADAMVWDGQNFWPRCFLYEGVQACIAQDLKTLDLQGAVLIVGAKPKVRAVIGALFRSGFSQFTLADIDDDRGEKMAESLGHFYFKAKFSYVKANQITQLPGIHSIVVNSLGPHESAGINNELFYFNFLKSGGVWLEMAMTPLESPLLVEAKSVGATVEPGSIIYARSDALWLKSCLDIELDQTKYKAALEKLVLETPVETASEAVAGPTPNPTNS